MTARFIQIHTLTPYHASLLNRDDAGFAKRIPFGGSTRTRISSQCLKRHWRRHTGEHGLQGIDGVEMSVRSRETFAHFVTKPLTELGVAEKIATAISSKMQSVVLGQSEKKKKEDDAADGAKSADSKQVTVLGRAELRYLVTLGREIADDAAVQSASAATDKDAAKKLGDAIGKHLDEKALKKNLEALKKGAEGLDAAIFGRMVTSDVLSRTDAAIHVAHAFTVHHEDSESDYFSAIDDIVQESGALGSGHINATELNTGLYYGYVVIDVGQLRANVVGLDNAPQVVAQVVRRLIHTIASVSPGAKKGATAPYSRAHVVLVEAGDAQPRSLANAFLRPVNEQPDLIANAYAALGNHLAELDAMYATGETRRAAAIGPVVNLQLAAGVRQPKLDDVANWAAAQIKE